MIHIHAKTVKVRRMVFFTVPCASKETARKGKDSTCRKSKNNIKTFQYETTAALYFNEIKTQSRHQFRNKSCIFGPSNDDPEISKNCKQ